MAFDEEFSVKFMQLPEHLRHKIKPLKKLTQEQKAARQLEDMRRNLSIFPVVYRHAVKSERPSDKRRGDSPPYTNRGGKFEDLLPSVAALESFRITSVGGKGKYNLVLIPKPDKSRSARHSFVDWVTFTFARSAHPIALHNGQAVFSDHDYVVALSAQLYDIFGYGVVRQRESGLNFYEKSYDLGQNGWGFVCIGGQNETVSITLKGQGLLSAKQGWEKRLFNFLESIPKARITRVDLANDNFNSRVSLDDYLAMYKADLFKSRGRPPEVEQAGNWVNPNGKGRTLYIGSRKSGKLLRIYEKGLQLANGFHEKFPNWVRVELELKNQDREIPYDVLLRPGQYLAGAYPALANMHKVQDVIKTAKKTVQSTFERSIEVTRHQFGKHIWTQVQILGADEAIRRLTEGKEEIPQKLNFDTFAEYEETDYLHCSYLQPKHSLTELIL
ncbi:replication initiation factor domain-containing protein [Candidatus Methylobacter oryzae]|uniref:replication initiation factor domain-containing protein n=1 Tax=Candidatus Methylobacter oryzae TaxID=2497749 RepID=UPI0019D5C830|nr:replication initiation factor domain-containing protein [Candidatus Methylobacter oryzae]